MAAASDVVNFAGPRRANKFGECLNQIEAVDIVAHLLAFVTKNAIRPGAHGANHEIRQKAVQLGASVRRTGEATAAQAAATQAKGRFKSALHSPGKRGRPHDEVGDQPADTRMNLLIRAVILQSG